MRAEQSRPVHEHKEGESEEEHASAHAEIPESEWSELKFLGQWKKVECDDFKKGIK